MKLDASFPLDRRLEGVLGKSLSFVGMADVYALVRDQDFPIPDQRMSTSSIGFLSVLVSIV